MSDHDRLLDLGGHDRWRRHDPRPGRRAPLWADPVLAADVAQRFRVLAATAALAASRAQDAGECVAWCDLALRASALEEEWTG